VELRKDDEEEEEEEIIWCIFSCSVHIRLYIKIKRFWWTGGSSSYC